MIDNKAPRVLVEKWVGANGKPYSSVAIFIGSTMIVAGNFCTDSYEIAKTKAKKVLEEAINAL